jgi:hypothetical protein
MAASIEASFGKESCGLRFRDSYDRHKRSGAPVYVVEHNAHIPSVLIECGFVMNPTDVKNINKNKQQLGQIIATGIENFRQEYQQNVIAEKAPESKQHERAKVSVIDNEVLKKYIDEKMPPVPKPEEQKPATYKATEIVTTATKPNQNSIS